MPRGALEAAAMGVALRCGPLIAGRRLTARQSGLVRADVMHLIHVLGLPAERRGEAAGPRSGAGAGGRPDAAWLDACLVAAMEAGMSWEEICAVVNRRAYRPQAPWLADAPLEVDRD